MFGDKQIQNRAKIGKDSSGNTIIQGSHVENPVFVLGSNHDGLDIAAQLGRYDLVQQQVVAYMEAAKRKHPLFPVFSADYNAKLGRLVSTPETDDAFRKYPKKIKGTYMNRYPSRGQ